MQAIITESPEFLLQLFGMAKVIEIRPGRGSNQIFIYNIKIYDKNELLKFDGIKVSHF